MERLDDQVAVITGAAQGIGKGIASVLASEGALVVIADIDARAAERVAAEFRAVGYEAMGVDVDVTNRASVDSMAARALEEWGRIDILAANAGIYPSLDVRAITDPAWDQVMDVNVKGAVHAVQSCLGPMIDRGYGRVVLTSSVTGPITGQPGFSPYGASKAAMLGFMRSAAVELARRGVTVNAVMPGNVATPGFVDIGEEHSRRMLSSIPMGRFAEPAEVGWAVRFLASSEAGYITGQTVVVDGGQVLPEAPIGSWDR
jgi:3-oxoacyl-[acyl-carrier protein] reductase